MPDSGDCSDAEMNQPSCSRKTTVQGSDDREKRRRRIIMRIEFNDSDDTDGDENVVTPSASTAANVASSVSVGIDLDTQPTCSSVSQIRRSARSNRHLPPRISSRQFRRRTDQNRLPADNESSSSGSEIDRRTSRIEGREKKRMKLGISEDESTENQEARQQEVVKKSTSNDNNRTDAQAELADGFSSESSSSSSNELLEKCPICLLTFRQQEIGRPVTCDHMFCAACIEAWANNVQTCPIDRLAFDRIVVLDNFERRRNVREIRMDSSQTKKELVLDDEDDVVIVDDNDYTSCQICNSTDREDIMLLCDSCNQGYHMDCLEPALDEIPAGSWYCDNCIDSADEASDEDLELAEDLHTLYEDIRGMGLPETRLRVRQVQQPRILRTRQNERIRAAVLRHTQTRSLTSSSSTTMTRQTTRRTGRTTTRTTRTQTRTRTRTTTTTTRRKRRKHRTYVVEYDVNNFDEKFAVKTSKKVIRRRRRKRTATSSRATDGVRLTASQRLAEQLGVKRDEVHRTHLGGGSAASFTLFGNRNDLDYFSDSEGTRTEDVEHGVDGDATAATAVQTAIRVPRIGATRQRKALLLGKARTQATTSSTSDILSSILDLQDRWHNATRNLCDVHINADGTLNLPAKQNDTTTHIIEAPLYQRGGATPNFGRGGSAGGNYSNRYSNNNNSNNSYRSGGGGSGSGANQYQRGDNNSNDNSFNSSNFNSNNSNNNAPNTTFTPFNIRFNTPNQQQQQQQQQQRNQNQQQTPRQSAYSSGSAITPGGSSASSSFLMSPHQQPPPQRQLFAGLPAPINAPVMGTMPPVLTVPPPPAPPPSLSWNSSLFKLNTDYGNKTKPDKEDDDDDDNCPNFSIYSQESQAVATELFAQPQPDARTSDKDDDEMNEDLVQLDDDDDIPLPPEPQSDAVAQAQGNVSISDLYEPENPTDEPDDDDDDNVEDKAKNDKNNGDEAAATAALNESDGSNSNSNVISSPPKANDNADDDAPKTPSTPSPIPKDIRTVDKSKGVLELYDDSDWEELEIDKPKEYKKALAIKSPDANKSDSVANETTSKTPVSDSEPERSYTPCLDEKTLEEEAAAAAQQQHQDKPAAADDDVDDDEDEASKQSVGKNSDEQMDDETAPNEEVEHTALMSTEQISEDEDITNEQEAEKRRSRSRHGDKSKRTAKHDKENAETFKKVGKRRKDRNYRTDKQEQRRRSRSSRSHSRTPRSGQSHSRSLSRSRSRSRSRSGTHTPPRARNLNRSPRRSPPNRSRSLSRSPRARRARHSRSKSYSRSRSNSQGRSRGAFRGRDYGRGFGRGRAFNARNQPFQQRGYHKSQHYRQPHDHPQHQQHHYQHYSQHQQHVQGQYQRPKRREMPRYDVRNVVSNASRHQPKDRYGRDAARSGRSRSISYERRLAHSRSASRSVSRSHSRSGSPPRRLRSFSMSPTPPPGTVVRHHHHQPQQHQHQRRSVSPGGRRFEHSPMHHPQAGVAPAHHGSPHSLLSLRSRSPTPTRLNGNRNMQLGGKQQQQHSPGYSPRYTPRLSRSRSKSPRQKKKKKKDSHKKKKGKKRQASSSPIGGRQRRISRQRDPFADADDFLGPQLNKKSKKTATSHWSPSPTPSLSTERLNYMHESNMAGAGADKPGSWTPPLSSPPPTTGAHYSQLQSHPHTHGHMHTHAHGHAHSHPHRSLTPLTSKKVKTKREKAKKKKDKQQRKEKKRKRHTMTPEPLPSKEVFASGNNILVSVSFNKEAHALATLANSSASAQQQQTVVTLPASRDEYHGNRRTSIDRLTNSSSKKSKRKRKKLDAKPVAIIDLERSPFQVHQEPADVIVLTDSEDANDNQLIHMRRDRRRNSNVSVTDNEREMHENGQREKTPPTNCMETIMETSYENLTQQTTGPKTPPEPHLVKFNLPAKKQHKVRNNPLHDDADDIHSADEMDTVCSMRSSSNVINEPHNTPTHPNEVQGKIGPNTPPESGPCSPDAYDPFEPTKSPSLSPRSPTPNPPQSLDSGGGGGSTSSGLDKLDAQKHISHNSNDDLADINLGTPTLSSASNATSQTNPNNVSMNPVDLVMALMNKPSNSNSNLIQQELANKSCDATSSTSQYLSSGSSMSTSLTVSNAEDKSADCSNTITVLSNVLLTSSSTVVSSAQHIPSISSPTTSSLARKLPKAGGSVASSSSGIINLPASSGSNMRNGSSTALPTSLDDSFSKEIESPYSPGSADYEDLFEPPPDGNAIGSIRRGNKGSSGKAEMFDNLFGSSSPVGHRIVSRFNSTTGRNKQRANNKNERKSKNKGSKSTEEHGKLYDDVPSSAVDLQVKDRFIRKLNRQERVVEEVKLVLKPHFNKKVINKDDYKDIMRRAVPKICHSRSGEINPHKIKNLIDAYVRKFRAKHKKLSLLNTGQVSSAVKCAAYLKKL